jgi:hypothetical protein
MDLMLAGNLPERREREIGWEGFERETGTKGEEKR